jgi:hypothetical protein
MLCLASLLAGSMRAERDEGMVRIGVDGFLYGVAQWVWLWPPFAFAFVPLTNRKTVCTCDSVRYWISIKNSGIVMFNLIQK